jgi:hypothetical protein
MGCLSCGRYLCDECRDVKDNICCCQRQTKITFAPTPPQGKAPRGRPTKEIDEINDPLSTWRKRAAIEFPVDPTKPCDWRNKSNVGGGKYPIVGCKDGYQKTIHHGPVKIEMGVQFNFNEQRNIHRICQICHHLWHHWNDAPYDAQLYMTLPHTPRDATSEELEMWANSNTRPKAPEPRTKSILVGSD